eukprot:XP_003643010.1 uncharacterized protein LOC426155 [Gallus gallus]
MDSSSTVPEPGDGVGRRWPHLLSAAPFAAVPVSKGSAHGRPRSGGLGGRSAGKQLWFNSPLARPGDSALCVILSFITHKEKSRRPARLSAEVRIRPKSEERQSPALGDGWPRGEHCCGPADGRRRPCAPAARTAEGGESELGLGMPRKQDEL